MENLNNTEKIFCHIIRLLRGSNKCPNIIYGISRKKYGWKDSLARYWFHKYRKIDIGKYTYGYRFLNYDTVKQIGSFTSIASGSIVVPNDHKIEWVTTSPVLAVKNFGFINKNLNMEYCPLSKRKVVIGSDVWIGANCIIFEGVTIGDGAVIAAGSIIRRDVPPYAVVASVDKIIKYRFSKEIIEKLLKIKWWNWPDEKIKENLNLFYEPEKFVKKFCKEEYK